MDRPSIIAMALGTVSNLTGSDVAYETGSVRLPVRAIVGVTRRNQVDANGTMVKVETKDFIIPVADLISASITTVPKSGHKIRVPFHGKVSVFEVCPIGDEPEWRYSDPDETHYRIHTKFIRSE